MTKETLSPLQTELLSRADAIFASISTAVGKATDFAAVQIPDIAMQYVAYGRAYTTTIFISSLIVALVGLYLFIGLTVLNSTDDDDYRFGGLVAGLPLTVAGFAMVFGNMSSFFMVWFAPKIWLITELVKLAK